MYGTKSLSYVKVKCWVESEDFHSPGSVTFIPESIYMHNTPGLKAINSQVFPDFRTVNKIYAEPSNQKEWGMYMTGDIFFSYSKVYKNK